DRLGGMVTEVSALTGRVRTSRTGSFGVLASESANTLAMVLTELLQNAVEHGYTPGDPDEHDPIGQIDVAVQVSVGRMHLTIDDDGVGLPEGFSLDGSTSLGLSIVRTLVESELGGQIELHRRAEGGTRVAIDIPAP
uniref:ATP-binding protein n=1 Tax=Nocardioides sp. TaxID=35761 RepID=UPI002B276EF5